MRTVRVISNGFGEDMIASKIIRAFQTQDDTTQFDVFPLVGDGQRFQELGLTPHIQQKMLPSGGFLLKLSDLFNDVRSGLLAQFQKQRHYIKNHYADYQIVVGDVFALFMATSQANIPTVFLPTAKSERAIPHLGLEFYYIRKHADLVFPRDIETHQKMIQKNIHSIFLGNPMFDDMKSALDKPLTMTIGILPGSRSEAIKNLSTILQIIDFLQLDFKVQFTIAIPNHFRYQQLKDASELTPFILNSDYGKYLLVHSQKPISIDISYQFFDVLQQSSLVIGLAGTANEQAMFAKRPVVSFIGSGPQSRKKRFKEQQKLIEGASSLFIDSNDPAIIAKKISDYVNHTTFKWSPLSDYQQSSANRIQSSLSHFFNQIT